MPDRISLNGAAVDLSPRVINSSTVAGSPAAGSITTIATITITADLVVASGILLVGWAAFTVGTNGISALLGIRRTNTTGTIVGAGNAATVVAANLANLSVFGFDIGATLPGQVYVLTLTVGSGSAVSTVSAAQLTAVVI